LTQKVLPPGSGSTWMARPQSHCQNGHILRILSTNI